MSPKTTTNWLLNGYPDNRPPRKIVPQSGLGFGSRSGLVLGLGGNQVFPPRKTAPPPGLWLGVCLGLVLGLGAIVLEPI